MPLFQVGDCVLVVCEDTGDFSGVVAAVSLDGPCYLVTGDDRSRWVREDCLTPNATEPDFVVYGGEG